jgi:acyl phosphate:glycerol-3-phosphate acyltransferase
MTMLWFLFIAGSSYLLGSIPFGYLLVRMFHGEDVRKSGSGNIGATNVSRKSPVLGSLTLLLDALKGTAAVLLANFVSARMAPEVPSYPALSLAAFFAIIGHVFPIWLMFRGGKGVATALGSFVVVAPRAVLISAALFLTVTLIFRYVSLGSIVAVASFPFLAWRLQRHDDPPLALILISLASLLTVAKHHQNIRRLLAGTESRLGSKRVEKGAEQ